MTQKLELVGGPGDGCRVLNLGPLAYVEFFQDGIALAVARHQSTPLYGGKGVKAVYRRSVFGKEDVYRLVDAPA